MNSNEYAALLTQARWVLDRYLFDGVDLRVDVAEVCAKIDNALSAAPDAQQPRVLQRIERAA